jgi:uncharacterized protein
MNPALHHGAISWSELMSKDAQAASDFYGLILPWQSNVMQMEGGPGPYLVQMVGERPVAGVMGLPVEGMPSVWAYYVTVDDVDASFEKALSLGAKKEWEPMAVPGVGRMAGFLDPQGAYIAIIRYEAMENPDAENPSFVSGFTTPGVFSWFSLQTTDVGAAKAFYAELFGWTYQVDEMHMGPYTTFKVGDVGMGGIIPIMQEGIPPHWGAYVTVDDADATAAAVSQHGGTVIMPPFDIPTVGRIAFIQDPTGAMLNVVKYAPVEQPA